jgi:hypothetical protein
MTSEHVAALWNLSGWLLCWLALLAASLQALSIATHYLGFLELLLFF